MLTAFAGIFGSRVFGLLRDMASAAYWGATGVAQAAFTAAFAVPNSLRALFGEGAFTSAFVPMLSQRLARGEKNEAWRLANQAISVQLLALTAVSLLFALSALILYLTGAFSGNDTANRIVLILPLLMPFAILICAAGAFGSVLNSLKSFFIPNTIQVVFNVVQIATIGLIACCWKNDELIALLVFCCGTLLSGFVQLLILLIACRRRGYVFAFDPAWRSPDVVQLTLKILPGLIGAGVMQLNSLVDKALGVWLGPAAVGALAYSQRLVYLPTGLFGVAMGIVCLPALSRAHAQKDETAVADAFNYSLRTVLFLALPCAAFLAPAGRETVALLFARGAFQEQAVAECTWALGFYIIGLPAFCLSKIAVNPFYARLDTKTPMLISLSCIAVNLILNLVLMRFLRQGGLALSTSISSWLNVIWLLALNKRALKRWSLRPLLRGALEMGIAALICSAVTYYAMRFIPLPLLPKLVSGLCLAAASYLAACVFFRRPELKELLRALLRK